MQTQGKLTLLVSAFGSFSSSYPSSLCPSPWVTSLSLVSTEDFHTYLSLLIQGSISSYSWLCYFFKLGMRKAEPPLFLLKSLTLLLSHLVLTTLLFHPPPPPVVFFFKHLIWLAVVKFLNSAFHYKIHFTLWFDIARSTTNWIFKRLTYSLAYTFPFWSNAFRCSHPVFKGIFFIFTSEAHSSAHLSLHTFNLQGK